MGSRLHGNDGRRRRTHKRRTAAAHPTIVIPATAGKSTAGGRRWVPVCTGTTGGSGAPTNDGRRAIPQSSFPRRRENPRRGAGDGFPSPRERRAAASFPRRRESTARRWVPGAPTNANPRWVPVSTGNDGRRAAHPQTTGGGGRSHNRHSRDGGNPQRGAGDGFPSPRGNDGGRRRRTHKRREAAGDPTIVIPATAGIHGGGPAMGGRLHGNYGRRRRTHKRQWAAGDPTIVIPATAGIHGEGRRWVPVSTGTTGGGGAPTNNSGRRAIQQSSFPRRRESTEGGRRWVPVSTGTTVGGGGHPQTTGGGGRSHNRHSRDGGNPQRGGRRWGSRLHGNDGRRRRTHKRQWAAGDPTIVIPATAGIHGEGPAMGSRLHGNYGRRRRAHPQTTGGGGRSHNRHSRDGGNPRRGAGDGVPSAPERREAAERRAAARSHKRREAAGDPTIVIPATAGIHGEGRRWGPVSTGTTVGGDSTNDGRRRAGHSRDGGNPQRGAGDGFPNSPPTNDGRRRRTHNRQGSGEAFVPSTLNSYDDYASLTVILAVDTITRSNCRFGSRASDSHVTSPF